MPIFYLIIAILILSQSGNIIRFAQADASAIGFWRLVIAVAILIPWTLAKKQMPQLTRASRQTKIRVWLCGFVLFFHFYTWFLSVQKTTIANSMILFSMNPLFTAIGAWIFFHEKMQKRHLVSLGLCFAGIFWMMKDSLRFNPEHFVGDLLGFLCAIGFSAYILLSKGLRGKLDNAPFALGTYFTCGVFFVIVMFQQKIPFTGYSQQTWAAFLALAIGSTLLGHALFTHCLKYLNVNMMSCSTLVEPIFSALAASYLFGEAIRPAAIVGFVLVTFGILVLYYPYSRRYSLSTR